MHDMAIKYIADLHDKYERITCGDENEDDNYPYPEKMYKEEFDKLDTGTYESEAIKHFKKMRLIRKLTTDKNQSEAHEYLVDFLRQPTLINEDEIELIGMYLVEIHGTMLELAKLAEKEPFYGAIISKRREFDQRPDFDEIFRVDDDKVKLDD